MMERHSTLDSTEKDVLLEISDPIPTLPTWKRMFFLCWTVLECVIFCGVMFGWASLVYVFKEEGIYSNLCDHNSSFIHQNGTGGFAVHRRGCDEQDSQFDLVFTIASSLCALMSFGSGQLNYAFGTRVTRLMSITLIVTGSLMLAFVSKEIPYLVFPGMTLLGVGGVQLLMTSTQIANIFPDHGSAVVGLLNGAFDISADVLLIIKVAFDEGISRQYCFIGLAVLNLMVLISTFTVYPRGFIPKRKSRKIKKAIYGNDHISDKELTIEASQAQTSIRQSLTSPLYLFHLVWFCILFLHFTYFVSALNPWLNYVLDEDKSKVSYFTNVHMYSLLPAIVVAWAAGLMYDGVKILFRDDARPLRGKIKASIVPQVLTSLTAVLLSVLMLFRQEWVLYITFLVVMVFRACLYATASAYLYTVFPVEQFGVMYSTALLFAGTAAFLQYAFFTWAQAAGFNTVNGFLAGIAGFTLIHPIYQYIYSDRNSRPKYYQKI